MSPITSLMDDMGERLVSVATVATHEVRRRTTDIMSTGVHSAEYISRVGGDSIHLPRHRSETVLAVDSRGRPPIIGTDIDNMGREVEIDPADIESVPLHDADGNPIGVLFPSQPTDIGHFVPWARMRDRSSDLLYRVAYERVPAKPTGGRSILDYGPLIETPWAKEVRRTGIPPLYVIAHANPWAFTVRVRTNNSLHTMFLGGESYGRAVAANPHLLRAAEGNDFGVLLPISCSPSSMYGSTGDEAARHLIGEAEMDRNIHMPRSTLILGKDEETGTSWLGAEALVLETGGHLPEFDSYWGSPFAFEDRP